MDSENDWMDTTWCFFVLLSICNSACMFIMHLHLMSCPLPPNMMCLPPSQAVMHGCFSWHKADDIFSPRSGSGHRKSCSNLFLPSISSEAEQHKLPLGDPEACAHGRSWGTGALTPSNRTSELHPLWIISRQPWLLRRLGAKKISKVTVKKVQNTPYNGSNITAEMQIVKYNSLEQHVW